MYTRSASFLLALFIGSVHASHLTASSPLIKRIPETLEKRAASSMAADPLSGLIEIRAPSDFDLIARTPTPVAVAESEPELDLVPAPEAAAEPEPFTLHDESPLLEYDGAEFLQKRATCPP
jgi:hypothetical protein